MPGLARSAEPETERDPFVGRTLEGRYRIEQRLGEGGLGTVYRAQHLKLARPVAVKVLREELRGVQQIRARFEREVKALSSLQHPNIVTITDYGVADGVPFLVMELVEGRELAKIIGELQDLPPARAIDIIRQILASLAYAHERDVVHRDLKPANVIVRQLPDGRDHATVLDFGLAKFVGDGDATSELTRSGLVVGTPAYMPPEQMASGARAADARSDLYAVGLMLFELLSGRRPFQFDEPAELLRAHLVMQPPTLADVMPPGSTVSPAIEAVIARALTKSPDERYPSAKAMIDAIDALPLDSVVRGAGRRSIGFEATRPRMLTPAIEHTMPSRPGARRKPSPPRSGLLMTAALGLAAVIAAAGGWMLIGWAVSSSGTSTTGAVASNTSTTPPAEHGAGHTPGASGPGRTPGAPGPGRTPGAPPPGPGRTPAEGTAPVPTIPTLADMPLPSIPSLPQMPSIPSLPIPSIPGLSETAAPEAGAEEVDGPEEEGPEEEAPFVAPAAPTGPRPRAHDPVRGRLPGPLARANARLSRNRDLSRADLRALTNYRNDHPSDVRGRILLGHAYMAKGWYSAALDQYDRAVAYDLGARGNGDMLTNYIRAARTQSIHARAVEGIARIWGREARAQVQRAIDRERDSDARARLQAVLARLGR